MTLFGFSLVLFAAVCHASWNFLVKRIEAGPELVFLFSAMSTLVYLPLALWYGRDIIGFEPIHYLFLFGTVILHTGYFVQLQTGYRHGDLSLVYPTARSTGPLLSVSFAVLVLGEQASVQAIAGGVLIVFGVLMLGGGLKARRGDGTLKSLGFGLTVGCFIGAYTVWDAYAVAHLAIAPVLMDWFSNLGRTMIMTPVALRRRAALRLLWKNHWLEALLVGIISPLAYILVLYAMTFTPVLYVAPLRETSVLLAVLLGAIVLKEGDLKRRLKWAVVIVTGVTLLATG
ncbi:DMT family transporter [Alisedimentitalea sp. MJ-SS2]|uniref:DMT family transporter n=1 Tax=Aliisedimentitalea sp. MJ-SS2 TaxID=3049795 RepID=UPI0029093359|nr:DMT family transporter [Alisedimentitalea sp. MJ-SS2]MDU8926857.1 DMT family transporter [Alisedimentitalea sp. MJ-SS2]